ncbi:hypothetical protein COO60DRAFT_1553080 [Scenedesmus sp. NREL 46B-D3]|nr:hypothetical protein COO60DRAFT_1553080 [Scenedesmus sp. NREL 46B-D3]
MLLLIAEAALWLSLRHVPLLLLLPLHWLSCSGMGGPPLMMLYEKLHIKKDTVRGCNAVLSVLQFRVIAYALTGIFTRQDLLLYAAVSVAGLSGLCLGSHLAARMDQATFSRVMVVLMLLCCALLFASSAGLTGS